MDKSHKNNTGQKKSDTPKKSYPQLCDLYKLKKKQTQVLHPEGNQNGGHLRLGGRRLSTWESAEEALQGRPALFTVLIWMTAAFTL